MAYKQRTTTLKVAPPAEKQERGDLVRSQTKAILREQPACLWRFSVAQQPVLIAIAGQRASAGCLGQLETSTSPRGAPQELRITASRHSAELRL